jgi:hypothetical protein
VAVAVGDQHLGEIERLGAIEEEGASPGIDIEGAGGVEPPLDGFDRQPHQSQLRGAGPAGPGGIDDAGEGREQLDLSLPLRQDAVDHQRRLFGRLKHAGIGAAHDAVFEETTARPRHAGEEDKEGHADPDDDAAAQRAGGARYLGVCRHARSIGRTRRWRYCWRVAR